MSNGTQQILESALEALQERASTLEKVIDTKQRELEAARREAVLVARAVKAQKRAIDSTTRTRSALSASDARSHYPSEGTQTRAVLDAINSLNDGNHQITLGVIVTRTMIPASSVNTIIDRLVTRGYVERVSKGIYRRLERATEDASASSV